MKYNRRKYLKTSKNRGCGNISPLSKKIKEKESYIFIIYITFNITGVELLVFLDDELTTFRNKTYRFICYVNGFKEK